MMIIWVTLDPFICLRFRTTLVHRTCAAHVYEMWNYPKSAKHQAFIDELHANHERDLAKVRAVEAAQKRAEEGRQALVEIKTKLTATRARTETLRLERLARIAANHTAHKSPPKK